MNWFQKIMRVGRQYKEPATKIRVRSQSRRNEDLSPNQRLNKNQQRAQSLNNWSGNNAQLASDLTSMYTGAIQDRRDYLDNAEELRRFPIAGRLLDILRNQILKPSDKGEVLDILSDNEEYDRELKAFAKHQNLDNLLLMCTKDILNLGEYTFKLKVVEGEGVVSINDTLDQLNVVAFYDRGFPSNYLIWKKNEYILYPPTDYCHFVIGTDKIRLALNDAIRRGYTIDWDNLPEDIRDKIPEFVRVGQPIFYNAVEKIRQLQILEQIVMALKLSTITQSKIVTLQVPASMSIDQVMEACRKFEETLNTQTGIDTDNQTLSVSEIMGKAGHFCVIPSYGADKGNLEGIEVRQDQSVDDILKSIEDFRRVLLSSLGIPYSYVFGSVGGVDERGQNKADDIRLHVMFCDMISEMQNSIRMTIKSLCLLHLHTKGHKDATLDDFEVIFKNASVNVGDLEHLEYDDAKQEIVSRKLDFIAKLEASEILAPALNREGIYEWVEDSFVDLTRGIRLFKDDINVGNDGKNIRIPKLRDPVQAKKRKEVLTQVRDLFQQYRDQRDVNGSLDEDLTV